jgi:integrase
MGANRPTRTSSFPEQLPVLCAKRFNHLRDPSPHRHCALLGGHDNPTSDRAVKVVMQGIRRARGSARAQKAAATAERMVAMLATIPNTLTGTRDRALLCLGFSGAFRRSELVALEVADLDEVADGIRVTIRKSKTDQEGRGVSVAILAGRQLRTVEALKAWLEAAAIAEGPIFRAVDRHGNVRPQTLTAQVVALMVKRYALPAGLAVDDFSGHSLRAGFLTSAADAGADVFKMADVSRHKSLDVLRGYVRRAEMFKGHAGASFL